MRIKIQDSYLFDLSENTLVRSALIPSDRDDVFIVLELDEDSLLG